MFSSPSSSSSFPFTLTVSSSSSPAMVEFQSDKNQRHGFLGLMKEMQQAPPPPTFSTEKIPDDQRKPLSGSQTEGNTKRDDDTKKVGKINVKKHKYAFQTRSQVDILDDGYRWRKYGQKAVKNNKFPRSYYRCTHQGCHVKKQVQRLSRDEGIVVTTYEGMHSHPIDRSTDNFEHILSQMQIYSTSL